MCKEDLNKEKGTSNNGITRKDALEKAGKYALFTAAVSMMILTPKNAQAGSADPINPLGGKGFGSTGSSNYSPRSSGSSPFANQSESTPSSGLRDNPWK